MRKIDADALKETIQGLQVKSLGKGAIANFIDEAPTIKEKAVKQAKPAQNQEVKNIWYKLSEKEPNENESVLLLLESNVIAEGHKAGNRYRIHRYQMLIPEESVKGWKELK